MYLKVVLIAAESSTEISSTVTTPTTHDPSKVPMYLYPFTREGPEKDTIRIVAVHNAAWRFSPKCIHNLRS